MLTWCTIFAIKETDLPFHARPDAESLTISIDHQAAQRTAGLTILALICFAANSLLCRLALAPGLIDPASFASVRVLAASLMLCIVVWFRRRHLPRLAYAKPASVMALFAYLICFSFAYLHLGAGTGALILFGAVQLTMFAVAIREGEHFSLQSWAGLGIAILGLVYLVLPGLAAPDPLSAVLMAIAGIAWGLFSLSARGAPHPVEANAMNFLGCVPPVLMANLIFIGDAHAAPEGIALAVASGAIASGLGYVIWYLALRGLTAGRASIVQLSVPAIAAFGGVVFIAEPITLRLLIASAAMLGGIAIVLASRYRGA
ncbi:MAG: DMT family transporter [Rhodomicrobium sp.]|nr:DMT family transporter [Rhodomicrobium sp.]